MKSKRKKQYNRVSHYTNLGMALYVGHAAGQSGSEWVGSLGALVMIVGFLTEIVITFKQNQERQNDVH